MRKYTYALEWVVIGSGYRHVTIYRSAREAIEAARLVYATLYVAIGRGNPENAGGTAPSVFSEISRKDCEAVSAEPRNKAFNIRIEKRATKG